jgi:hypothetical protein
MSPNQVSMAKKTTAPRMAPSNVPKPPTSAMKIMYAVHSGLK